MKRLILLVISALIMLSGCNYDDKTQSEADTVILSSAVTASKTPSENLKYLKIKDKNGYKALNYYNVKAVWFSYIDLADMLDGYTKAQFENNIDKAFENVKKTGFNTVYVHVRPFGDAFYNSEIYPQTRYCNFDALEIMVKKAHSYGLSIHAWVNPLRLEKEKYIGSFSDDYLIKKWYSDDEYFNDYVVKVNNSQQLWLNPAYKEVRDMICQGVIEIVKNYNVDGIHIDDYFYPTTNEEFDKQAFLNSQYNDLSEFRTDNINLLVSQMYNSVKSVNNTVLFGISPQGNIHNNYSQQYADVKKWAGETGYCDYIVPQIYYGFENKYQPFEQVLEQWSDITCDDVKLVVGLAYYKIHNDEEFINYEGIISAQIDSVFGFKNTNGVALYNYKNIFVVKNANSDVELALLKEKL